MRRFTLLFLTSLICFLAAPTFADTSPPDGTTLRYEVGDLDQVVTLTQGEALPAPVPTSAPSPLGEFAKQFLTPTNIASVVVTLLGLIGGALGLSTLRKRQVAIITQHAYNGVEDFSKTTENTVDDKVAQGLKIADEWMKTQGWRPLSDKEKEVVKLGFNALHGAEAVAVKVQAEALKAAAVPPAP